MKVLVEPVELRRDERGSVFEPLAPAAFADQQNAHVVVSRPGAVRGNHYHQRGTEVLTVLGPALVRFRDGQTIQDRVVGENEAVRFTFPPGVAHAVKNTGSQPNIVIAFNTVAHDPQTPDVFHDILIES